MIKKLSLNMVVGLLVFATYGQTIVSTTPEPRNVVLEEYTGIYCVYCPQGHAIAQAIQNSNPGKVFLINIHQGGFAVPQSGHPDFRTIYGDALAAQTGLAGYPAATVNRQNFPGREQGNSGSTAMGRNYWSLSANEVLAENSYLNLAVSANIELSTGIMDIHVEGYYTGNSPQSTNLLNVVILQNNTKGPQTGGNMGNNYNHMHRLIDMVTGQWGDEISTTTSGTFFEKDYTYQIKDHHHYLPTELGELEVVVFMTETHQTIITGNGTTPTISITNTNDANVRYIEPIDTSCPGENLSVLPKVNIQNVGTAPITSLNISYTLNGDLSNYNWTGNLASAQSETVTLPTQTITTQQTNTLEISLPSDDDASNNQKNLIFEGAPAGTGTVKMELITDQFGSECRWRLKDSSGSVIASGGPYGSFETINERFDLSADCYTFTIMDTYGDGGTTVTLTDSDGKQVYYTDGNFGSIENSQFGSNGVLNTNQTELQNINIYPIPTRETLNISNAESADIEVFDMLGRTVISKENITLNEQLNVSSLKAGAYFITVSKENNTTTKKFIISR